MGELTATATCIAFGGVEETTGEVVGARPLAERVGFLAVLVQKMTATVVSAHWSDGDLMTVGSGVGPDGRALPPKGWMALRRLGWTADPPKDVYVSDRVRRAVEETAARALRLAVYRASVVRALLDCWPAARERTVAEWAMLSEQLPAGVTGAEIRNRTRQVRAWRAGHNGRLPAWLTDLEDPPWTPGVVLLTAADKQFTTIERTGPDWAVLRVQLPRIQRPGSRGDWAWHAIRVRLPVTVPAAARLCLPTLRLAGGRVRVDLPWRLLAPSVSGAGHMVGLGVDWGVNTLLTGSVGKLADTTSGIRVVTDGRRLRLDATGISAKLHRLREHREHIAARRDHYDGLIGGLGEHDPARRELQVKHAVLKAEHQRVCDRIRRLGHALAWAAGRWTVDQADALGATVIYLEDLSTLEARGRRRGNARLSGQVRGLVVDAIRHLAAKLGIAVVTVPARGTSRLCPRCGSRLHHAPAPNRANEDGWKWAVCPSCGLSGDRDHAASERIVSRGLLAQQHVHTHPKTGCHTTNTVVEGNVARARRPRRCTRTGRRADRAPVLRRTPETRVTPGKGRPTPARPKQWPTAQTLRRVPDRCAVPAPTTAVVVGKRPAGQAPQTRSMVGVGSGPARDCRPSPGHPRPGAGWGFHRNVTATGVLCLGEYGPVTARPRPPETPELLRKARQSETLRPPTLQAPPSAPGREPSA
jgi:hypothetical protein